MKAGGLRVVDVDIHPQQSGRESFALSVSHQAQCSAAAEAFVKEEIERFEIWQLEAIDAAFDDIAEMLFDTLGSDFANEQRVIFVFEGDQTDVCGVAFVAGTGMCKFYELDLHNIIGIETYRLSIRIVFSL